jgi:hypothetical protein
VWRGLPVLREGKWAASFEEVPENITEYPTGCSGSTYITTPATAARIAKKAENYKFFWIDDVWVTGYLAQDLNITHLELASFGSLWTLSTSNLLMAKSVQSPELYHSDYIAGLMSR